MAKMRALGVHPLWLTALGAQAGSQRADDEKHPSNYLLLSFWKIKYVLAFCFQLYLSFVTCKAISGAIAPLRHEAWT